MQYVGCLRVGCPNVTTPNHRAPSSSKQGFVYEDFVSASVYERVDFEKRSLWLVWAVHIGIGIKADYNFDHGGFLPREGGAKSRSVDVCYRNT